MVLKPKKRSRLEELGDQLVEKEKEIRELEEENAKVFTSHKSLTDEREGLIDKIKAEARRLSEEGTTKVLYESTELFISVQGKTRPMVFDLELVDKLWSAKAKGIAVVRSVDGKLVKKAIELGELTADVVLSSSKLGELPTPAVTVRLI